MDGWQTDDVESGCLTVDGSTQQPLVDDPDENDPDGRDELVTRVPSQNDEVYSLVEEGGGG